MTATFLLPFAVGACTAVGGNVVTDAFGVVALVAMTPLIALQVLGLVYKLKSGAHNQSEDTQDIQAAEVIELDTSVDEDIIDL